MPRRRGHQKRLTNRVRKKHGSRIPVAGEGISKGEFHRVLDKASQPIEKPESEQEQS